METSTTTLLRSRLRLVWPAMGLAALAVVIGLACIIPDRNIQVFTTDLNLYPVRFVEGIPVGEDASCACTDACQCPLPPLTGLPTFLDPEDPAYQFCTCNENRIDENRLRQVRLFVEDQDDEDGVAKDNVYAAALIDWDPAFGDDPSTYIAYRSYLDPRLPLDPNYTSYETTVIKRPRPHLRSLTLSDTSARFDLCNAAGVPVGPGFHTLSFIVSDRPWFEREPSSADTGEDEFEVMPVVLEGVPDIAAGATYDIQSFVFQCLAEEDENCGCADIEENN